MAPEFSLKAKQRLMIVAYTCLPILGFGIDLITPSLPHIQRDLNASAFMTKLLIVSFVFGYGLFQLVSGPISDSFGRKKPIYIGLGFATLTSALLPFAPTVHVLVALRFLQGVSISFSGVAARAIASDLFEGDEFKKYINYTTLIWALAPIIAPFFGGYLQHYYGWQAAFAALAAYVLVTWCIALIIYQETIHEKHPFKVSTIAQNYRTIFNNKKYIAAVLITGFQYSMFVIFNTIAPFLVEVRLKHTAIVFGYIALCMGVAWFLGNLVNRLFIKVDMNSKLIVAFIISTIASVVMLGIGLAGTMNIWVLSIPAFITIGCGGLVFPNTFAYALGLFPRLAGTANSIIAASVMMMTGFLSGIASYIEGQTQVHMAMVFCGINVFCLLLYFGFFHGRVE